LLLRMRGGSGGGGGGGGGGGSGGGGSAGSNYVAPATMIVGAGGGPGQGSLAVLEGPPGVVGEVYTLSKPVTVIGRNPSRCDIVFYPNQESSMSRVHCTIRLDGKFFVLIDNNSSNGTHVNGTRIKGNDPVQLRERSQQAAGDLSDRTFIVDDESGGDQFKES
jgi:hypothetical protein